MIRRFLLLSVLSLPLMARAYNVPMTDTIRWEILPQWEELLQPLEPAYLKDAVEVSPWRGNWFVDVSGGVSAFVGSPLGCGDIFDRMKPALSVSVGKWFTPAIGTRIVFQGLQFKDALLESRDFQHLHADLMWNVMPGISRTKEDFRWDLVPYVGLGILHNDETGRHPFAVSYGVQGRCRLTDRLHLTAELGCATTFKDFDGMGAGNRWGDRLLSLTAGFSYTIGKKGWKRVVDAAPYIERNERLTGYARSLRNENERLRQKNSNTTRIIAELEKILKLEGLLDKYADRLSSIKESNGKETAGGYPKNDYSGLNSLRARLRDAQADKDKHKADTIFIHGKDTVYRTYDMDSTYRSGVSFQSNGSIVSTLPVDGRYIGPPIYFFFVLDTDRLTDPSQLVNLDGIARIVKKHGLRIQITGAADSATGNDSINNGLSQRRAAYMAGELRRRGVDADKIETVSVGGINDYNPVEANRNVCVRLLLPSSDTTD
ncbi:OmpA family protein [Bacteroides uniformis]|uniref:OmpA family protein n=1 Tax=Bacteroides uniformis TaxID=820 RepID=UPI001C37AC09|nr:OmpA family protein [Bacteroides uniformis]MBV4216486.1 OmpA family protein [Bacteroides uniformis]MBV4229528.1 OmpA family protein [Bacteroides uniformis]MCB7403900.1 OmpA family protein [Bacteroides uniformis]MCB7415045.1 OmpA family protein [Bacteroides uniformis]